MLASIDENKCIPQSAVSALKTCKEKGIKLFAATARTPDLDKMLGIGEDILSLFSGGVFCNGAVNILDDKSEYSFINRKVINSIVNVMRKYPHINLSLQSWNNVHAFNNQLSKRELSAWGVEKDKIFSTENISYEKILKVLIFDGGFTTGLNKLSDEVINILFDVCGKLAKVYLTDEGRVIQIGSLESSKYNGAESIRKRLGYQKDEIAVFGDDFIDMEIMTKYKNCVAMGNAVNEIKSAAGFVTKSNIDNGIQYGINVILKI